MGFWHTSYMEFHEPSGEGWILPQRPPVYPCTACAAVFDHVEQLEIHRFEGHAYIRPTLLFGGNECGKTAQQVTSETSEADWATVQTDQAWINGNPVEVDDVPEHLAQHRAEAVVVRLANRDLETEVHLHFSIALPEDLDGVDRCLLDMAAAGRLDLPAIEKFLSDASPYATAGHYLDGLAHYFYGVLARERSPQSGLKHEEYRERYDMAASALWGYPRAPAQTICDLIAFHYNQFGSIPPLEQAPPSRLTAVAARFRRLLNGGSSTQEGGALTDSGSTMDRLLSDEETELVLSWCALPLDGSTAKEIDAAERHVPHCDPYDALKLRVAASTHHVNTGTVAKAVRHAHELRNNPAAERWAQTILSFAKREQTI